MQGDRSYYKQWPTGEVIELVEHLPFCHGSAFKYLLRPAKRQRAADLEKAAWYIRRILDKAAVQNFVFGRDELIDTQLLSLGLSFARDLYNAGYQRTGLACKLLSVAFWDREISDVERHKALYHALNEIEKEAAEESDRIKQN